MKMFFAFVGTLVINCACVTAQLQPFQTLQGQQNGNSPVLSGQGQIYPGFLTNPQKASGSLVTRQFSPIFLQPPQIVHGLLGAPPTAPAFLGYYNIWNYQVSSLINNMVCTLIIANWINKLFKKINTVGSRVSILTTDVKDTATTEQSSTTFGDTTTTGQSTTTVEDTTTTGQSTTTVGDTTTTGQSTTSVGDTTTTGQSTTTVEDTTTTAQSTTTVFASTRPPFSHVFTTCGTTGLAGPSQLACETEYKDTDWSGNNAIFNVNAGVQTFQVFTEGRYRLVAYGAKGGLGNEQFEGGKGAKISGEFYFTAGTVLNIVIGQAGSKGSVMAPAGGGGGTFVYTGTIGGNGLLIAAGGGGGGGLPGSRTGYDGQAGEEAISSVGLSGHIGFGGIGGVHTSAGAGWRSDGAAMLSNTGIPGSRWNGGNAIAVGNEIAGAGGFGGGGGGVFLNGGGGAGGYTGGDGVNAIKINWGGSGGGSFNGGANPSNQAGINDNHGRLEMTLIG